MMSKHLFAAALSAAFFLTAAAVAEVPTEGIGTYEVVQADTKNTNEKAAQDLDASRKADDKAVAEEKAGDARSSTSKVNYLTRQAPTDWTAEALIGRTVENRNGDNLGEINNVVINENGNVVAVVVGVGGFLGIGEKDVGVPFDVLEFRTDAQMDRSDSASTADRAERRADDRNARFDTEHDNMRIVLTTSKEDLEAAPDYAWLDEQAADGAKRDNVTTAKTEADCVAAKGMWDAATSTCAVKKM
jgi:opacity protein-like surface antigen